MNKMCFQATTVLKATGVVVNVADQRYAEAEHVNC